MKEPGSNNKPANIGIRLLLLVSILTVLFSFITVFNQYNHYLELFSHFRLQYLLASILFLAILLVIRQHGLSMLMLACIVLNSALVVPWYLEAGTLPGGNNVHDLKIIHSNVYTPNVSYRKVVNMVRQERPDIFVAQEVDAKWIEGLKDIRGMLPYYREIPRDDNFGIAIYSKYPLQDIQVFSVGSVSTPGIRATIRYGDKSMTLLTMHSMPPIGGNNYNHRNRQIIDLARLVKNITTPLVFIGDLNITMWSNDYKPLETGTRLSNARKGFGIIPTWPVNFPLAMIPIDQCLVSDEIRVKNIKAGPNVGSDHLPLIVSLALG